jgi:hypothetical protein
VGRAMAPPSPKPRACLLRRQAGPSCLFTNTTVQQFLAGINTLFAGWDQKVRSATPRLQLGARMSRRSGSVFLKVAGSEVGAKACSCPCE